MGFIVTAVKQVILLHEAFCAISWGNVRLDSMFSLFCCYKIKK